MARQSSGIGVLLGLALAGTAQAAGQDNMQKEVLTTVRDRDVNGGDRVSETVVTRTSQVGGREHAVIETYVAAGGGHLVLSERVHRVTIITSDGSETVEHTETQSLASPGEAMRLTKRSVTTVRRSGTDLLVRERRDFELDVNGRFVPTLTVVEHISSK